MSSDLVRSLINVDHAGCSESGCPVNDIKEQDYVTDHFVCCDGTCKFAKLQENRLKTSSAKAAFL
jgi:hypothetical protein